MEKTIASPKHLSIEAFDYNLPDERIARFPLEERDASRLLIYRPGFLGHAVFRELPDQLPGHSLLVFNDTRVIHARLHFLLPGGGRLEILCLEPLLPAEYQLNFSTAGCVRWKCLVGGNRRWKSGRIDQVIDTPQGPVRLQASRLRRLADAFEIEFRWEAGGLSFGELLAAGGIIPLPPYLNRESTPADADRYQTIYAREQGSVAAPTAGLHFTDRVFEGLRQKNIGRAFVTLHVGAGTFKPVKSDTMAGHDMHRESIYLRRDTIATLAGALRAGHPVVSVGTTSLRTLESLYWHGLRLHKDGPGADPHLHVGQWEPYDHPDASLSPAEALDLIVRSMDARGNNVLEGQTQLLIAPGYRLRLIDGLITNFHQPRSTLLLLVAALAGDDWRRIYDYALDNDFRFLSYGDSSLLWKTGA